MKKLLITLSFMIACIPTFAKSSTPNCSKDLQMKVIKIQKGKYPNGIIVTVKNMQSGQTQVFPEYQQGSNGVKTKINQTICMETDYD